MKDILFDLIKGYYKTDIIQKKVIILGEGQKQQVHIIDALMPLEWDMKKTNGDPDIEAANSLLEKRRKLKAQQLFRRTEAILKQKDQYDEWNRKFEKPVPRINESPHEDLMQYSEGALYFLEIMTPYDYTEMTAIIDEKGILQGMRLHPKEQDDITEGALDQQ